MEQNKMKLPIGTPTFRAIRENNQYYVDKTMFAAEILQSSSHVTLITRPRRFGKTLNMSMLAEFLDICQDSKAIFQGLGIMNESCADQINTAPVIFMTFKDVKQSSAPELLLQISDLVWEQYVKFQHIYHQIKDLEGKEEYILFCRTYEYLRDLLTGSIAENILSAESTVKVLKRNLSRSLKVLTQALATFYNKKSYLLIDEYDTPIIHAYTNKFKKDLGDFFTVFYGTTLKDNAYLEKATLTGIQRVAKENIFSGLNNLQVCTVVDEAYSSYFGLTEREVKELLEYYHIPFSEKVRDRYNGYCFGRQYVYNPWSIMNYVQEGKLKNFWVATSSNALVENYLKEAGWEFYENFDKLASERHAQVYVGIDMALDEFLGENEGKRISPRVVNRYLWGLLINAGYLTFIPEKPEYMVREDSDMWESSEMMNVCIPNGEVYGVFRKWMLDRIDMEENVFTRLLGMLEKGDMGAFSEAYSHILESTVSYYDISRDNRYIYHAIFLGMCMTLGNYYHITSNHEYGAGRPDIRMESRDPARPHIVIEIKSTRDEGYGGVPLDQLKEQALRQIQEKNYYAGLNGRVLCLGLAHDGKRCEAAYEIIE